MPPQLLIPVLFVCFVIIAISVSTYNKFVKYRNRIEEAWSTIDVALKRRANLIPNLVRVIEGYSAHENKIFEEKIRQLSGDSDSSRIEQESKITKSLGGLLAIAEAYPDLKASENFLDLQNSLDEIEQEIQQARNRYNGYIGRLNTLVESFPSSLIAQKFDFVKQDYLTLELTTQREMPGVDFK
jgi:LemA protein